MSESSVASWPSETNCADPESSAHGSSTAGSGSVGEGGESETGRDKRAAIEGILDELDGRKGTLASRALSVVPGHRLREEVTREVRGSGDSYKAKTVRGALKAFLRWFAEQEDMQIVFENLEGEEETAPLPNSFESGYVAEKYGVIKDAERAFVRDAEEPHTVMLTLSGSNVNSQGKPRCPGDHLVDLKESWNPYVRRELQRAMDGLGFDRYDPDDPPEKWWEYAVVLEPHKSGYVHMHIAVFTSHEVSEGDFEPVMEKHVEKCEMAGTEAHSNYSCSVHEEPDGSCDDCGKSISVNSVDPEAEHDPEGEMEDISNLGSYLAAYIGGGNESLWDRSLPELISSAVLWSTGARRVQFSQGFHRLADEGMEMRGADDHGASEDWDLVGVEDGEGEVHEVHQKRVCEDCGELHKGELVGSCVECGGVLKSLSADYMREIRGIPGGDPPPKRG